MEQTRYMQGSPDDSSTTDGDNAPPPVGKYMDIRNCLSEGTRKGVEWLESQSNVLQEVDQLVELMTAEKTAMNHKIVCLKDEVKELKQRESEFTRENTRLKMTLNDCRRKIEIHEEEDAKLSMELKQDLEESRAQLEEMKRQMEGIVDELTRTREDNKSMNEENDELREQFKRWKLERDSLTVALENQRSENMQCTGSLSCLREQCRKLRVENNVMHTREKEMENKLRITEEMIMAMKGRAATAKRYEEQLKMKCSSLEQALDAANRKPPQVLKVPCHEKTRVEMQLIKEIQKKDDALSTLSNEFSACQVEKKTVQVQKCKLDRLLLAERRKNGKLAKELSNIRTQRAMEERVLQQKDEEEKDLRRRLKKCMSDLRAARRREHDIDSGRRDVEFGLSKLQEELHRSKQEIVEMRALVEAKDEAWWQEKQRMEHEKLDLISDHNEALERMKTDLLQCECQCHYGADADDMVDDAKEEYRRLKEASTKRCTELAKEVWALKAQLQANENHCRHHHHHHVNDCYDADIQCPAKVH